MNEGLNLSACLIFLIF